MLNLVKTLILVSVLAVLPSVCWAQSTGWQATRLRGQVFVLYGDSWQPLNRGDTVPNRHFVFTAGDGRVVLERGEEQISLAGNTQIMIDSIGAAGERTTVFETFGVITVNVAAQAEAYFEVRTHELAAVVKGTRFVVSAGDDGSQVAVRRGLVEVQDLVNYVHVNVKPGQQAEIVESTGSSLSVTGAGDIELVVAAMVPGGIPAGQGGTPAGQGGTSPGQGCNANPNSNACNITLPAIPGGD